MNKAAVIFDDPSLVPFIYNTTELLGLTGGIISLLAKVIRISGKLFLSLLYYLKKKEKEKLLERYG